MGVLARQMRAAVVTMNPHEAAAIAGVVGTYAWQRQGQQAVILGRFPFSITSYVSQDSSKHLDHVHIDGSGNITAAMVASHCFNSPSAPTYDIVLMFGCAGLNPAQTRGGAYKMGDVVIVERAVYAENGTVKLLQYAPDHLSELVSVKQDRLRHFSVELSGGGTTNRLAEALDLPMVSALCTDKVLSLDGRQPTVTYPSSPAEVSYAAMLAGGNYDVVDMESFGFLWSLQDKVDRVAIIRVLTDRLGDHSASVSAGSMSSQASLLASASDFVMRALEVQASAKSDGPRPSRRKLSRAGIGDIIAKAVATWSVPYFPRLKAYNEFIASSAYALESDQLSSTSPDGERVAEWLSGLTERRRLGYGDLGLARLTLNIAPLLVEWAAGSQVVDDQAGLTRREDWREAFERSAHDFLAGLSRFLDPTSTSENYVRSIRAALRLREVDRHLSVVRDSEGGSRAARLLERSTGRTFVGVTANHWRSEVSPHRIVHWSGFQDDMAFDELFHSGAP